MSTSKAILAPPSFTKACEQIKAKGFSHVKVELEAKLGRNGRSDPCSECNQSGWTQCSACNSSGYVKASISNSIAETVIECGQCQGDGRFECRRCNGRGFLRGGWSDRWCRDAILRLLKPEVVRNIVYSEFYYDGSVDSEYTFTMPTENAHQVINVIEAFNGLADRIGNGLSIDNAGMHISVLPSGTYPCRAGLLDQSLMRNFRREVAKLLPALYFLGTHTSQTRGLSFRKPHVSSEEKYSAIYTHGDTAIEYRLFDPCFDKPEAFYDKLEVIAATLKYYSNMTSKTAYKIFNMYDVTELSRLYGDTDNYEALLSTVKEVKPDKTFTSLKAERHFNISKPKIKKAMESERQRYEDYATADYERLLRDRNQRIISAHEHILSTHITTDVSNRFGALNYWQSGNNVTDRMLLDSEELRNQMIEDNPSVFGASLMPAKITFDQWLARQKLSPAYILTPDRVVDEEYGDDSEDYDDDNE
jgi:hypothetical protein